VETLQLMIDVLGPVVLIVVCGALVGQRLGLEVSTLSKLAYWVLGPAFVFDIFASTTLDAETAAKLAAAGVASVIAAGVAAVLLAPLVGLRGPKQSAVVMSSAYGNVGNAGLAICAFALGDDALDRAGVLMVTIVFFGTLLAVWLGTRQRQSAMRSAVEAIASPMIVAAIIGFGFNLANLQLPVVADRAVSLVADALIPLMLFTLGLQLREVGGLRFFRSTALISLCKLAIAPLTGWLIAEALGLTGIDRGVVILQSAMPPAVFCMVMAIELDLEAERTTNDVVVVTMAALLTLPIALALVV